MTILELYHEMHTALKGSSDAATIDRLTTEAGKFASTVSWAAGVIDKDGRIVEAFDSLREIAFARFKLANDSDMATLHDALADLILAIRTHDEDLDPLSDSDEHDN